MADITAIFGSLLIFGIAFPGLLTSWWLLFPKVVQRAQIRIERTPWACFWFGVTGSIALAIPIGILLALPFGPAKFTGVIGIFLILTLSSLGAAAITALMAGKISPLSKAGDSDLLNFIRSAILFELAAGFPILGWVIVVPISITVSLGATLFALLHWRPREVRQVQTPSAADLEVPQSA